MPLPLYTAIVFMNNGLRPRKYRNITHINKFEQFCVTINANYFNLYEKTTKNFVERIYIKKGA